MPEQKERAIYTLLIHPPKGRAQSGHTCVACTPPGNPESRVPLPCLRGLAAAYRAWGLGRGSVPSPRSFLSQVPVRSSNLISSSGVLLVTRYQKDTPGIKSFGLVASESCTHLGVLAEAEPFSWNQIAIRSPTPNTPISAFPLNGPHTYLV